MRLFFFFLCFSFIAHASQGLSGKKTICLNMIVKDESEVIEKCLNSVRPFIDYWVISDTGSMDGTQEIIQKCLAGIPGELHEHPWVDFAHNRNQALKAAKNKGDYLLFIDADEVLEYGNDFTLGNLDKDCYYINVQGSGVVAKRKCLVNNQLDWTWKGVVHEDIESPQMATSCLLQGVVNRIDLCVGHRGKDPDKHLKEALILEKALQDDPENTRYAYYLAQCYHNAKKYELALESYKRRIAMRGGDEQETFLALYDKGRLEELLGDSEAALQSFFQAYEYRPTRAEPLFEIAKIYRKKGRYLLAYLILKYALGIPCPESDVCIFQITYAYGMQVELANCLLLWGRFQEALKVCCQLLTNPYLPQDKKELVARNCEVARQALFKDASEP